jgi:hypothetical protein
MRLPIAFSSTQTDYPSDSVLAELFTSISASVGVADW